MNLRNLAIWGVIVVVLIGVYSVVTQGGRAGGPAPDISYSQLLQRIDSGDVKQVVVSIGLDEHIVVDGTAVTLANLSQAVRSSAHGAAKVSVILNSDQGVVVQRLIEVMDELKSKGWDTQSIAAHRREANPT